MEFVSFPKCIIPECNNTWNATDPKKRCQQCVLGRKKSIEDIDYINLNLSTNFEGVNPGDSSFNVICDGNIIKINCWPNTCSGWTIEINNVIYQWNRISQSWISDLFAWMQQPENKKYLPPNREWTDFLSL